MTRKTMRHVQPLMGAVRKERQPVLQREAARALVELMEACVERKPSPNDRWAMGTSSTSSRPLAWVRCQHEAAPVVFLVYAAYDARPRHS